MKIKEIDLKKAYASYVDERKSPSRGSCPSIELIRESFEAHFSRRKKTEIVSHITNCSLCAQEFILMAKLSRADQELETESNKMESVIKDSTERRVEINPLKSAFFSYISRPLWRYAAVLFLLIMAGSFFFLIMNDPQETGERGSGRPIIEVIGPSASSAIKKAPIFEWREVSEYEYYVLELFDERLVTIWKSGQISKGRYVLPEEFWRGLPRNHKYFWIVSAYRSDIKGAESSLFSFRLTE